MNFEWLAVFVFLAAQTGSLIWFLAAQKTSVANLVEAVKELKGLLHKDGVETYLRKTELGGHLSRFDADVKEIHQTIEIVRGRLHKLEGSFFEVTRQFEHFKTLAEKEIEELKSR